MLVTQITMALKWYTNGCLKIRFNLYHYWEWRYGPLYDYNSRLIKNLKKIKKIQKLICENISIFIITKPCGQVRSRLGSLFWIRPIILKIFVMIFFIIIIISISISQIWTCLINTLIKIKIEDPYGS